MMAFRSSSSPVLEPTTIDYKVTLIDYKRLALCTRGSQGADSVSSASPALTSAACPWSPSSASMK
jgi:hypothetical protein